MLMCNPYDEAKISVPAHDLGKLLVTLQLAILTFLSSFTFTVILSNDIV
jgi:hypothetical protein